MVKDKNKCLGASDGTNRLGLYAPTYEIKYTTSDITDLLSDNGRLQDRVIHLTEAASSDFIDGFICKGSATFKKEDSTLQNLLTGVVPAKDMINAIENLYVVYHLDKQNMIPVLAEIKSYQSLNPIGFDEECIIIGKCEKIGKRKYHGEADVYCKTTKGITLAAKMIADYFLVKDSDILFEIRDRKA